MDSKLRVYRISLVILVVSFCCQLAGMASDGWIVTVVKETSETYNIGLYYASYCKGENCSMHYIEDLTSINGPLYDKQFMVYRVGTALAAALTFVAIIFLSRLTTQCCADCQTCAGYENHLTCIHCLTLAGGLLSLTVAGHVANDQGATADHTDYVRTPYSVVLTGIGGILALLAFFIVVITVCRENDHTELMAVKTKKYISPEEYFEKSEINHNVSKQEPPPQAPDQEVVHKSGPPSYASSRRTYADFMAEPTPTIIEYIDLPSNRAVVPYRQQQHHRRLEQQPYLTDHEVHSSRPNVYHVTLK